MKVSTPNKDKNSSNKECDNFLSVLIHDFIVVICVLLC